MPYRDMRNYLAVLEQQGRLKRVAKPVDRSWEPASLVKWMFQALPHDARFGLMFEHVVGSAIPLITGALGASAHSYALALGATCRCRSTWIRRCASPPAAPIPAAS